MCDPERILSPSSASTRAIQAAIDAFASVVPARTATYVAVPMTSGWRFVEWYAQYGRALVASSDVYRAQLHSEVVKPNILHASRRIDEFRARHPLLIDPTQFDAPDWTQDDYRFFWGRVISRYVQTAIFLDGWEFSSGCCYEFGKATSMKISVLNEDLRPLGVAEGTGRIERAVGMLETHGVATVVHHSILAVLRKSATAAAG